MVIPLEALVDVAEAHARRWLIGTTRELAPLWAVVNAAGEMNVLVTPWQNITQKHFVVLAMRELMQRQGVVAYSFLDEAWVSQLAASEMTGLEYRGPPPSERANRREAVICQAADKQGRTLFREWELVRDASGACAELRLAEAPEQVVTIFDNLLESRKPS